MRMLKRAAVTFVTAGSLTVLGAGVAHADPGGVSLNLNQTQNCSYQALVPINVAALNLGSSVGSFSCAQTGSVG